MKKRFLVSALLSILLSQQAFSIPTHQFCVDSQINSFDFYFLNATISAIFSPTSKVKIGAINNINPVLPKSCITYSPAKTAVASNATIMINVSGKDNDTGQEFTPVTCKKDYPSKWGLPVSTNAIVTLNEQNQLQCTITVRQ